VSVPCLCHTMHAYIYGTAWAGTATGTVRPCGRTHARSKSPEIDGITYTVDSSAPRHFRAQVLREVTNQHRTFTGYRNYRPVASSRPGRVLAPTFRDVLVPAVSTRLKQAVRPLCPQLVFPQQQTSHINRRTTRSPRAQLGKVFVKGTLQNMDSGLWTGLWTGIWTQ